MITRSRFFVASLWAALGPAAILIVVSAWVVLFPDLHKLGDDVDLAAHMALIGAPFVYTAAVVATYCIARALYEMRILSRRNLILAYVALAILFSALMTVWLGAGSALDYARAFALFLTLSLVASGSAVFVWWRTVSRVTDPNALDEPPEPRIRVRRRTRRSLLRRILSRL